MTDTRQLEDRRAQRWRQAVSVAMADGKRDDLRDLIASAIDGVRQGFTDGARPRERWFATLQLDSLTVDDGRVTVVWRDPANGQRHGWRYAFRTPDDLYAVDWRLHEELATSEPTDPDADGVRWWGVHQWVDGELIRNRGA